MFSATSAVVGGTLSAGGIVFGRPVATFQRKLLTVNANFCQPSINNQNKKNSKQQNKDEKASLNLAFEENKEALKALADSNRQLRQEIASMRQDIRIVRDCIVTAWERIGFDQMTMGRGKGFPNNFVAYQERKTIEFEYSPDEEKAEGEN